MKRLLIMMLCPLMCCSMSAADGQEIIEYRGDRYVIHVDAMEPDKEMTLMDVLLTCPELLSSNGKRISELYEIRFDDVPISTDNETLLQVLKAVEIETIEVTTHSSLAIGGAGDVGIVDIYFKQQESGKTSGKLLLEGSTRGNGKAYADVITRSKNVTLRGYALTNLKYARGDLNNDGQYSSRQGAESVQLNMDWDISEDDNLKIKLFQDFVDSKQRFFTTKGDRVLPEIGRNWMAAGTYNRTLNERGGTLTAEGGVQYFNVTDDDVVQKTSFAYAFAEANLPCLNNALNILVGWEIDYSNQWTVDADRQQMMFNDPYVQLDYTKGPWVLTLGDHFRIINYWHRTYNGDTSLWNNNRTEHSWLASAGYKAGKHFIQGTFCNDYVTPIIDFLYAGPNLELKRNVYLSGYRTNRYYTAEARYAYQQAGLSLNGSVEHKWNTHSIQVNEKATGVKASVTWHKGILRLTAGAGFYHWEGATDEPYYEGSLTCNYFNLRLLPTLLLGGGLRISSRLLYNSHMDLIDELPAHLYASVKVSKDLGRHITISADFHDLAGTPRLADYLIGNSYDNRALTLGFTYRFF